MTNNNDHGELLIWNGMIRSVIKKGFISQLMDPFFTFIKCYRDNNVIQSLRVQPKPLNLVFHFHEIE